MLINMLLQCSTDELTVSSPNNENDKHFCCTHVLHLYIAIQVEQLRKKDADNDHEIAKILEGKINRKVITHTPFPTIVIVRF